MNEPGPLLLLDKSGSTGAFGPVSLPGSRSAECCLFCTQSGRIKHINKFLLGMQVRVFKDLIKQKEHMVLPDLAQDLAQVLLMPSVCQCSRQQLNEGH